MGEEEQLVGLEAIKSPILHGNTEGTENFIKEWFYQMCISD